MSRFSMTTRGGLSIPVDLSPGKAMDAARAAIADLGWSIQVDEGDRLVVREDPTRLHCHCQPVEAEVTSSGSGTVEIETSVPGRGPISTRHLRTETGVLARRILSRIAD